MWIVEWPVSHSCSFLAMERKAQGHGHISKHHPSLVEATRMADIDLAGLINPNCKFDS